METHSNPTHMLDPWKGLNPPPVRPHVAVLGAGGPAGFNLIRCLERYPEQLDVTAFDSQPHHLALVPSWAHKAVMQSDEFDVEAIKNALASERRLVVAQPDTLVAELSKHRDELPTYLPGQRTIELAQDKASTAIVWAAAGLTPNRFATVPTSEDAVEARRRALTEIGYPMWLRARTGAGARLACRADHRGQADLWCRFVSMRFGEPTLLAEEFLPGRDYGVTLLYWRGELTGVLIRERLEYLYPQHAVSGRTGTPTAARLLVNATLESIACKAVESLGAAANEAPHGMFCIDLREDKDGRPVPTECNAGRFFTTSHAGLGAGLDLVQHYVGMGLDGRSAAPASVARIPRAAHGTLVLRHIDAGTTWLRPDEITDEQWSFLKEMTPP